MEWAYSDAWSRRLFNSIILLSRDAKRVELISFSGPKIVDSDDCKQRGTKWSAEGAERVPSQPASKKKKKKKKKNMLPLKDFKVIFEF